MYPKNSFITLTYADEHLHSPKLVYSDFQKFMKKLRKSTNDTVSMFVTGEYGETTKRPHWHAIIFNWEPPNKIPKYKTELGHQVYTSETLTNLWGLGNAEFGSVTIDSAGYCARYSLKKQTHGKDGTHDFEPISKKSSKHAIGKRWLERYYPDVFLHGHIVLEDGTTAPIPRYYEKWLKEHQPDAWLTYVTRVKLEKMERACAREKTADEHWWSVYNARRLTSKTPLTRNEVRRLLKEKQYEQLEAYLKL